ncbi:electron transport protein SCO1/SenC [Candidatus Nitrosoglobus terrae]|uniref:Electron transport protein SCO1/SenC n=1 Tax=Candidatus Nitrosoglobus terrae TaxID=1630141 RepID=A0A1Q2SKL9_9GAMM|nr:SCO family protein [Candidatus Nitrosoglobus terrae]BAW79686.1 electron transport protein SCO1/SenC [Candidatus Nitrosoglobus terrae]
MKTLFLSTFLGISGLMILWVGTDGGRAFTAETARRLEVQERPKLVPIWHLEDQNSKILTLSDWANHYTVVDFIYTSCTSACLVLGSELQSLQKKFELALNDNKLRLLSISFDPEHDTPERLRTHLSHFSGDGEHWVAARPTSLAERKEILDFFKVTVIPDKMGGYTHSAGYHVINPHGQLVAIFGVEEYSMLQDYLSLALSKEGIDES